VSETPESSGGKSSGFLLGIILGAIVGAAAAYLATDDKSNLRKQLLKKGKVILDHWEDFKDDSSEKAQEIKEAVVEKVESIPEAAQEVVENVKKTADKVEMQTHKQARNFFLSKGKPLAKK